MMGGEGLTKATQMAVVNANYVAARLNEHYPVLYSGTGGLVAHELGHVPRRGEELEFGGLCFQSLLSRGGAVRWFKVSRVDDSVPAN